MSRSRISLACLMMALFVLTSLVIFPSNGASASAPEPNSIVLPVEFNIIKKTNAERKRYGLKPLQLDPRLMKSARRHATWMTMNQNLQHTSESVGENIAMGQRNSDQAVQDWMNSSGHRANILDPNFTRIGAAAYIATDGSIYWCQQFLR